MSPEEHARAAFLRQQLKDGSDEDLDRFLSAHAIATVAGQLVRLMTPDARAAFFSWMRTEYPVEAGRGGRA